VEGEPHAVVSWKSAVGVIGWLTLLAGAFVIVLGCGDLAGSPCSSRLIVRSMIVTGSGAFLLLTRWVIWGDEDGSRERSSPKSRLKKLMIGAFAYAFLAIFLAILIVFGGLL